MQWAAVLSEFVRQSSFVWSVAEGLAKMTIEYLDPLTVECHRYLHMSLCFILFMMGFLADSTVTGPNKKYAIIWNAFHRFWLATFFSPAWTHTFTHENKRTIQFMQCMHENSNNFIATSKNELCTLPTTAQMKQKQKKWTNKSGNQTGFSCASIHMLSLWMAKINNNASVTQK